MLAPRIVAALGLAVCLLPGCDKTDSKPEAKEAAKDEPSAVEKLVDRCVEGDIQPCNCDELHGEQTCHDGEYETCDCSQAARNQALVDELDNKLDELENERKELDKELQKLDDKLGDDDERAKLLEEKAALEKKLAE